MIHIVRLADNTIGTINSDTIQGQKIENFIGERMNIHLHDENGFRIEVYGILVEVMESIEDWNIL